ncbi:MAG: septal ring lytic transglycosylase RlpA family protein [Burkholderiales bacterium]
MRTRSAKPRERALVLGAVAALVAACSAPTPRPPGPAAPSTVPAPSAKYYADDGPPAVVPEHLDRIPDAVPKVEPLHRFANRPYVVLGREYVPATALGPYRERGVASWYGRMFHGKRTSTGEIYDMTAMTAAHPTLPLPSYARVTSVETGRSVVVRVNDRGPFLHGRVIDLSYAAAHRLGIAQKGSGEVVVEALLPASTGAASVAAAEPVVVTGAPEAGIAVTTPLPAPPAIVAAAVPPAAGVPRADPPPVEAQAGGFVVQLGAFASEPNAQTFLAHVRERLAAADVEPRVRQAGGLFRVYVGPFGSRDEARKSADRLLQAFGLATSIAPH